MSYQAYITVAGGAQMRKARLEKRLDPMRKGSEKKGWDKGESEVTTNGLTGWRDKQAEENFSSRNVSPNIT